MFVLRRYVNAIVLNPFEYLLDDENNVRTFDHEEDVFEFLADNDIDVENADELETEYGIYIHEIDQQSLDKLNNIDEEE